MDRLLEWAHYALGFGILLANVAVVHGVRLEHESNPPDVKLRGFRILVLGLAFEAAFGVLLFGDDTAISLRQKAEVSAAQATAARAVLQAGRLGAKVDTLPRFVDQKEREINGDISAFRQFAQSTRNETSAAMETLQTDEAALSKQTRAAASTLAASRHMASQLKSELSQEAQLRTQVAKIIAPWTISDAQLERVADALAPFAGQQWQAVAYWDNKQSLDLANRIYVALGDARWRYLPLQKWAGLFGGITGVLVYSHPQASPRTRAAAAALVKALNDAGIQAEARDKNAPGHPDDIVILNVGTKPPP